jgi:hypothetical protein
VYAINGQLKEVSMVLKKPQSTFCRWQVDG